LASSDGKTSASPNPLTLSRILSGRTVPFGHPLL